MITPSRWLAFSALLSLAAAARAQSARPVRTEVMVVTVFRDHAQFTATARTVAERGSSENPDQGTTARPRLRYRAGERRR